MLQDCCRSEARRHLKKHRDVATCDRCKSLLLAYGNPTDFDRARAELEKGEIAHETEKAGSLYLVAKRRA
jgi:hypothetical protein